MTDGKPAGVIRTRIWQEEPEPDNPFAAALCRCHGYDVYGDLLGQAGFIEYLYLLFKGEPPDPLHRSLLENLAVALANPGPRDQSVHAAMAGGVGGATAASCLMAALSVGAGGLGGAREVRRVMENWQRWGNDLSRWQTGLLAMDDLVEDVWPAPEHPAGFDPNGVSCPTPVRQTLEHLSNLGDTPFLSWLRAHRLPLEAAAGIPLAMSAVAAAALSDLGFQAEEGEMLTLLLRLPGAAVHALEQNGYGYKRFPFFEVELIDDPAAKDAADAEKESIR